MNAPSGRDIVGVVLGAGSSRRLGRPKQTLPLGASTVLGTTMRHVVESSLDRIVLVVGHESDEALAGVDAGRAEVAYNAQYGTGCASSLLAGLDEAKSCDALVMILGDMPGVTADTIDRLVDQWRSDRTFGAIVSYRGALGHPLLFSSQAFDELRTLHGDKAVWKIVDREPEESMQRVRIDEPLPGDVDTWSDYVAVCEAFEYAPPEGLVPVSD